MNQYMDKIQKAFEYAIESDYTKFDRQNIVRNRFKEAKTVCFWGTGEFFHDCYGHPGFNFDYVCDNDPAKWGKEFRGKKCLSPDELKAMKDTVVVLVMVGNYIPIQKQLDEMEIENYNGDDIFCNVFDKKYDKKWFEQNLELALQTVELFADEKSKEIYTEVICNRIAPHLADKIFNQLKTPGEYFQQDVFSLNNDEVMVDAGAFDGDSALNFIKTVNGSFEKIYAFELEKNNYDKMLLKLHDYKDRIEFIDKGVWSHKACLNFGGAKYGSHIDSNAEQTANVISIDEVVQGQKVTFIKMDVEGSELEALNGAKNTILTQKPKLAISAYHYLSDLWNVPQKIKEFCPDYQIYLRHHAPTVWDTDCYAYIK